MVPGALRQLDEEADDLPAISRDLPPRSRRNLAAQILVANQTKKQTIALALGAADKRTEEAEARVAITEATVRTLWTRGPMSPRRASSPLP